MRTMFELNIYELAIGMTLQIHEGYEAYFRIYIADISYIKCRSWKFNKLYIFAPGRI
jgi:hypothetical protein